MCIIISAVMSESKAATSKAALDELMEPWCASEITETQQQRRADVVRAKELWNEVLRKLRDNQRKTVKAHDPGKRTQPFFPFVDLPAELRNMIYNFCLDDEKLARNPDMTKRTVARTGLWSSKTRYDHSARQKRVLEIRAEKPTDAHREEDDSRKAHLDMIAKNELKRAERSEAGLTAGAREAFDLYKLEYDMYASPSAPATDGENNHDQGIFMSGDMTTKKGVLEVDVRGNLVDDLPMLSYVDREIFSHTLFLYYSTVSEGLWVRWVVRNLDFFPFLRFYQAFTTGDNAVEIPPSRLHIEIDDIEEEIDDGLHAKKFVHAKRLIELHWLEGLPLFGCLTGLCDRGDCKGPFGDYMYSVRQIVALYRIDNEAWHSLSVKYLHDWETMDAYDSIESDFTDLDDAELVEQVIDTLCKGIEYNLGYKGSYSRLGRDKTEWSQDDLELFHYKGSHAKTAYEKEHAIVRVVSLYRKKVDRELRWRLGNTYEEWERLPDRDDVRNLDRVIL